MVRATEMDRTRLRERRPEKNRPFDTQRAESTTVDDLAKGSLRPQYEAERDNNADPSTFPGFEQWLSSKQLGERTAGGFVPNHAALLVFGRSPQNHIPGAIVELVRYGSTTVDSAVVNRTTVTGTIPDQLNAIWTWIAANVLNPGGPYGRAAEGPFGEHSDYRNPLITGLLLELHLVERLGRGVRRVKNLLEQRGLPDLQVETNHYTRVIIRGPS